MIVTRIKIIGIEIATKPNSQINDIKREFRDNLNDSETGA
jgi:hypothetical protein